MIPKANQRAGGRQLATHLLNEFDNDRVEVADLRGAIADHLHGAFDEWSAVAKATRCQKFLYSLSVNPDPRQRPVTRDEYYDYIARVEKALGLTGQPRAVVFHTKHGREHCHVVWSRINEQTMRAVHLPYDRQALRTLTQEFARDRGWELPPGMRQNRLADRFNNRKKFENLAEKQQEERTGMSKAERMAAVTAAWRESDNALSFAAALEARGYFLARGDKRTFVVVDLYGEIHALARQIENVKTKDVRKRLASVDIDKLPDARRAQDFARDQLEKQRTGVPAPSRQTAAQMREELAAKQGARRAALDEKRKELLGQHLVEREALTAAQESQTKGVLTARLRAQPKGVIGFLARITGLRLLVAHRQRKQDRHRAAEHARQTEALDLRHARESRDFEHRYRGLMAVEFRERLSLETALRRKEFRKIAGYEPVQKTALAGQAPQLTPEQRARLEAMRRAGLDMTTPLRPRRRSPDSAASDPFTGAAAGRKNASAKRRAEKLPTVTDDEDAKRADRRPTPQAPSDTGGGLADVFRDAARKDKVEETARQLREERKRRERRRPGSDWDRER